MAFTKSRALARKISKGLDAILGRGAARLIWLYQKTLSPDHSWLKIFHFQGFCRFYPSCSEYWKQAFLKKGFFQGFYFGLRRLCRCHPFSKGGMDEKI